MIERREGEGKEIYRLSITLYSSAEGTNSTSELRTSSNVSSRQTPTLCLVLSIGVKATGKAATFNWMVGHDVARLPLFAQATGDSPFLL